MIPLVNRRPVAVGVAEHAGWAHLVSVAAADGMPAVVDRRRVKLIEAGVPTQPYHHETLALPDDESEQLLRPPISNRLWGLRGRRTIAVPALQRSAR